jgi:hypothetical protein
MLRQLWDKISTRLRPDRASFNPIVDFDPKVGSLSIQFAADIRGQKVTLGRRQLQDGFGFRGHRKFKLDPSDVDKFERVIKECHWENESTAHFEESRVPDGLKVLRTLNCRETKAAQKVVVKNIQPKINGKTLSDSG